MQTSNRANYYFDCKAMQVAVATMRKLVGQESVGSPIPPPASCRGGRFMIVSLYLKR